MGWEQGVDEALRQNQADANFYCMMVFVGIAIFLGICVVCTKLARKHEAFGDMLATGGGIIIVIVIAAIAIGFLIMFANWDGQLVIPVRVID